MDRRAFLRAAMLGAVGAAGVAWLWPDDAEAERPPWAGGPKRTTTTSPTPTSSVTTTTFPATTTTAAPTTTSTAPAGTIGPRFPVGTGAHVTTTLQPASGAVYQDIWLGGPDRWYGDDGIRGVFFTARRLKIEGFSDGAKVNAGAVVEDCWIRCRAASSADHNDGLQAAGGTGDIRVSYCDIDAETLGTNAAIFIADFHRGRVTVENCLLAGGGYPLRLHDQDLSLYVVRNVVIRRGYYGWVNFANNTGTTFGQWSNVTDAASGRQIRPDGSLV